MSVKRTETPKEKKAPNATKKVVSVEQVQSPLEMLKGRITGRDKVAEKRKVEAEIPATHKPLYDFLKASGTGQTKLDFLLTLEFVDGGKKVDAKEQGKIAEIAMLAFAEQFTGNLTTIAKIQKYSQKGDK